jgi:outer membrane protein assembly factor BamB
VKRIATPASEKLVHGSANGRGMYGIAASKATGRLYYNWHQGKAKGADGVGCLDLKTDKVVWERAYDFSCARVQVSVDGKSIFVARHWEDSGTKKLYVLDAATGEVTREYDCGRQWPQHPLVVHPDGKRLFFPGAALDIASGKLLWTDKVGGTGNCHIVLDHTGTKLYTGRHPEQATVATWIIDANSGKVMHKVPLDKGKCPELTGGVTEVVAFEPGGARFWGEASAERFMLHFDNNVQPPKLIGVVDKQELKSKHGYKPMGHGHGHAMVSGAGDFVWFSTGIVLDARTGAYRCQWTAEDGKPFQSAKMLEVDFLSGEVIWTGQDQGHGFIYNDYPLDKVRPLLRIGGATKDSAPAVTDQGTKRD